jgi:hypothetical protein
MVYFPLGQQGDELLPDGLDDVWLDGGHGIYALSRREASDTPRMIEHPVPALQVNALRPYWRGLLARKFGKSDAFYRIFY